ncbi:hypothetical protein GGR52DRAFT_527456 [Hypoxylon sp. FL1284]|nr:hypothetical protein GGR52DRAFT_527456 [Hypoxylon sp. FL1284]
MDPGTILSILQLAGSMVKLGSKVGAEFWADDRARDKLVELNLRLQRLHQFLDETIKETPDTAPSELEYPGASSIIMTLDECKRFLENYNRTLSTDHSLGGATRRERPVVGPDGSKLEEFSNRIHRHLLDLDHWTLQSLKKDILSSINRISTIMPPATSETTHNPYVPLRSPREESGAFTELATTQPLLPNSSPKIRANTGRQLPDSMTELPPPRAPITLPLPVNTPMPPNRPGNGPVQTLFTTPGHTSTANFYPELDASSGSTPRSPPPTRSIPSRGSGHTVTLHIGSRDYKFNTNCYRLADHDGVRVVDWANNYIHIRHFVSAEGSRILHTIPNDNECRAFFLPKDLKHRFEITTLESGAVDSCLEKMEYQFDFKSDRETFQRRLRSREYLTMVQATKIHNAQEKDMTGIVHLKVWRRDSQDEEPTFSFAAGQSDRKPHHEEYKIRWFKRQPEFRGDNKLMLRLYSFESGRDYGPQSDEPRKKQSPLKAFERRMPGETSQASPPALLLHDHKGIEPPSSVRCRGDLEIEFANAEFRRTFVNACYDAHRPPADADRRNSTPSPVLPHTPSRPPLGPKKGPHELTGEPILEMPSPSLMVPVFEEARYDTESPVLPPDAT